jgi:glycosyltransferase involved in cell wall biosynthesis
MPTLSVCLIVKNEQEFLAQCLNSIKNVADEIIIIDTGSTDKTKAIARLFTNQIYDFQWCDDFSAARNEAIKHATKDWVLFLDADETIAESNLPTILEAITLDVDAYQFVTRTYLTIPNQLHFVPKNNDSYAESEPYVGWIEAKMVRMFRRKGYIFSGQIHESIVPAIQKAKGVISEIPIPIHHFGLSEERKQRKTKLYHRLGKNKLETNPNDHKTLLENAKRAIMRKDFTQARTLLEKICLVDPTYEKTYPLLIYTYANLNLFEQAQEVYNTAKKYDSGSDLDLNLAISYEKQEKYQLAINLLLRHDATSIPFTYLLGKSYYYLSNFPEARRYLTATLKMDSTHIHATSLLINALLKLQDYPEALIFLGQAIENKHPQTQEFKKLIEKIGSK